MDPTGQGIAFGVLAAAAYAVVRTARRRSFDLGSTVVVALATFSLPAGVALISTAVTGEPGSLPAQWREYVAVAGVAVIGLSVQYLVGSFRSVWVPSASRSAEDESPAPES